MKIKLSKSQWEKIGQKSGWGRQEQEALPKGLPENYKLSDFTKMKRLLGTKEFGIYETSSPDGTNTLELFFGDGKRMVIHGTETSSSGTWELI